LVHRLRRLTQSALLHAQLTELTCKLPQPCCLLLANAKLLPGQLPDAHSKILELTGLLTVDTGNALPSLLPGGRLLQQEIGDVLVDRRFLSRKRSLLGGNIAVLLRRLQVLTRRLLAKTRLLDAELAQPLARGDLLLRQVAIQPRTCLAQLCLLHRLLPQGLADVGQLPCGGLTELRFLSGKLTQL
jgi:hypothetical protein